MRKIIIVMVLVICSTTCSGCSAKKLFGRVDTHYDMNGEIDCEKHYDGEGNLVKTIHYE